MHRISLVICLLFIFLIKAKSQGISPISGGSIGISYTLEPERKFRDAVGGYKYSALGINAKIPLFMSKPNDDGHFFETSLHADFQTTSSSFGFIDNTRNFLNESVGLGAIASNGGKNIMVMNAAIGVAADKGVIDNSNTRYRFSGTFIINHRHSSKTVYMYGIAFSYAYGKPLPLPVLGLRTKLSDNWTFSTLLPVEVSFINKLNAKTGLSFSIRPAGNRFQFDNTDKSRDYSSVSNGLLQSPSTVFLQLREFQVAMGLNYKLSKQFILTADAGFLLGGQMKFTDQDDPKTILYETGVKPGVVLKIGLRYRFAHKGGNMRGNKMNDILNPLGN